MVWSEERRWRYVREHGYEIVDELPDGWRVNEASSEPKPFGFVYVCTGSLFDGDYRKALMRRSA